LRMFAMIFKCFSYIFAGVSEHVSSVSIVFNLCVQVLCLDVSKVDRVLHML
jgi:hypothetical protein